MRFGAAYFGGESSGAVVRCGLNSYVWCDTVRFLSTVRCGAVRLSVQQLFLTVWLSVHRIHSRKTGVCTVGLRRSRTVQKNVRLGFKTFGSGYCILFVYDTSIPLLVNYHPQFTSSFASVLHFGIRIVVQTMVFTFILSTTLDHTVRGGFLYGSGQSAP